MKKFLAIILVILMALSVFVGCEKEDTDTEKGATTTKGDSAKIDFYIDYKSAKIELGGDAVAALNALGTPKSSEPQGDCSGKGSLTKYVYDSIVLYVLDDGKSKTVDQITLLDDSVKTPAGIKVGSSREEVMKAYGEKSGDGSVTYKSGNNNLMIGFRDGSVSSIDLRVIY